MQSIDDLRLPDIVTLNESKNDGHYSGPVSFNGRHSIFHAVGSLKNGKINGYWHFYYGNNNYCLWSCYFDLGIPNGEYSYFSFSENHNANMIRKGWFKNGNPCGQWQFFNGEGEFGDFVDGLLPVTLDWEAKFENGDLIPMYENPTYQPEHRKVFIAKEKYIDGEFWTIEIINK